MSRQWKKLILTLFTFLALFVIANKGQTKRQTKMQLNLIRKRPPCLENGNLVDELESIQKVFIPKGMKGITFARFIEAFKDFKNGIKS